MFSSKLLARFSLLTAIAFCACEKKAEAPQQAPPKVEVIQIKVQDVPIVREFVATLDGFVNAQIRAQVTGYLMRQAYQEGTYVQKGTLLFEIDPRPFQASLDQAKGNLQQAEGNVKRASGDLQVSLAKLGKTELDVKRYIPLAKTSAISQQELDDAIQANLAAKSTAEASSASIEASKSAVEAGRATVAEAELKLSFTKVTAPIDGIPGLARAQVGDLVGPSGSTELTTISTLNPIKAYFTIAEQEFLNYNRALAQGERKSPDHIVFDLVLSDGTIYNRKGKFFAVDRQVDPATGAIRLAALFPNPDNLLRPGEFGRVRSVVNVQKGVTVVPQRAVSELQGAHQVAVVGADNKVSIRPVKVGERIESDWIILEGLKPGERVIAEGTLKVRDGMPVEPLPYRPKQLPEQRR